MKKIVMMKRTEERLLEDIQTRALEVKLWGEKYTVFRNQENTHTVIVRQDSKGSVSVVVPDGHVFPVGVGGVGGNSKSKSGRKTRNKISSPVSAPVSVEQPRNEQDCTKEDHDNKWKESIPRIRKTGDGTERHIGDILVAYRSAQMTEQPGYFRPSWYDDSTVLPKGGSNGAMKFTCCKEGSSWLVKPIKVQRVNKSSCSDPNEWITLEEGAPKAWYCGDAVTAHETTDCLGNRHCLYASLAKMCGSSSFPDTAAPEGLSLEERILWHTGNILKRSCMVPEYESKDAEIRSGLKQSLEWLAKTGFSRIGILASALRASSILKSGIDTGTKRVRFPQRGFKDTSDDEKDIPREEDRNAKALLLALAVHCSGTIFYPVDSLNSWTFSPEATQHELRRVQLYADVMVDIASELAFGVAPESVEDGSENASVERALSYLKGSVKLFQHQLEGLEWSLDRERSEYKGGFIASDMGMGKSVQMLMLILCYSVERMGRTLIVAPNGLLMQPWYKEATDEKYWGKGARPFGNPLVYTKNKVNPNGRAPTVEQVKHAKLVIVSYDNLRGDDTLKNIPFKRVILDESSYIKNPTVLRSLAVRDLRAPFRWCLSGTPIENKPEDYMGQLLFLQIAPFYHQDWWHERYESDKHRMFHCTMFRRVVNGVIDAHMFDLPVIYAHMSDSERAVYDANKEKYARAALASHDQMGAGKQILNLLKLSNASQKVDLVAERCDLLINHEDYHQFEVSFEEAYYQGKLNEVIKECIGSKLANPDGLKQLRQLVSSGKLIPTRYSLAKHMDAHKDSDVTSNSNVNLEMIEDQCKSPELDYQWKYVVEGGGRDIHNSEKCVVFVQGKNRAALVAEGIRTRINSGNHSNKNHRVLVRGSSSAPDSASIIDDFQTSANARVLILNYRGGAHGLNLQVARNVFLLDSDWNPAILAQAVARCYRIGQTHDVYVHTLVTADSVEERVQQVVNKKLHIFRETINGVSRDVSTWEDIKSILQGCVSVS